MINLFGRSTEAAFTASTSGSVKNFRNKTKADEDPEESESIIEIGHSDELPAFAKKLYDVIHMAASTRHMVCPIEISSATDGKSKFSLLCLKEEVSSDIADEVTKQLMFKGFQKGTPFKYIATQTVMAELARDIINEVKKTASNNVSFVGRNDASALWQMFESIVSFAMENDASDIHFEVDHNKKYSQIQFRVDGRLTAPKTFLLNTHDVLDTIAYLYNIHGKSGSENTYNENKPQQCHISCTVGGRKLLFRWASNQSASGTKLVLRMLSQDEATTMRSLTELGYLPGQIEIWKRAITRLGGGTILSGVVGSGKSTTMQTVMSMLPAWMAKYTVEDPIEYRMPGVTQFSVSRILGDGDSDPFLAVKRQLKRMDPDAVLIGEIRDKESAGLFRDIAESGHRAFSTLHAPSAIDIITMRLVSEEIGVPKSVIATPGFMNLLVYQALVPKLCPECNRPAAECYSEEYLLRLKRLFGIDIGNLRAKNPDGCDSCKREHLPELNGSKGRLVVAEMIELDATMLDLFRQGLNSELKSYIRGLRTLPYDDPDSTGKSALEVAIYHVARGTFDPSDVETKFGTFEDYENQFKRGVL